MSVSNKCSRHSSRSDPSEMLSSHMTCETVNSEVGVVKSSNCVINIEYMVQDEKIMFEVFKSTVDSNCVLKRNIVLNKSNDPSNDIKEFISSLSDTAPFGSMKINKTCQTDPVDLLSTEPKIRTRSPKNKKVAFECPEKDTTGKINSTEYKEIYAVSSFKFIEPKPIASSMTKHNFCALNFDGTLSRKHRHSAKTTGTKPTNLARVKSDTNILRVANNLLKEKANNRNSERVKNSELTKANEIKMQKDVKKKRHKSVETTNKKQYGEPDTKHERVKNDGAQFEIVLTPRRPKNSYGEKVEQDKNSETIILSRQKPRKFIVKSNTLELLTKPEMKSVALQTTPSSFIEKNILLKDLYAKPYYNTVNNIKSLKSMDSGDANLEEVNLQEENEVRPQNYKKEVKKYNRRPFGELNLTKTVNPCIEIKTGPENIALSPRKTRPTIPRRRINTYESCTDENVTLNKPKMDSATSTPVPSIRTKIPRLREDTTETPETHLINDNLIAEDLSILKTHITNWLTNSRKHKNVNTDEYNKEVDELCSKITMLLHMNSDDENDNSKSGKKQENVDKSEIINSKLPAEKFGIMKHELRRNNVVSKPINISMIEQLKNKSPRLKICRNDNVIIFNENSAQVEQNKLAEADRQKRIMQNAFGREMSNLSSKTAKSKCNYNKNDIKTQIPQNKINEQIINTNENYPHTNENYPHTNVSKRLRIETKTEEANCLNVTSNIIQRHQQQNKSNTLPNKSFASKKYEHTKINEQFFKQCMVSRKRNNSFLNGDSTVTINSQENKSTITSGQKRKSGIPLRSRTFSELTKPNTAPTKPDMFNSSTRYLSRNSLDTNISEMSKIKESSLKQSRSAIFNSQNFEEFKSKTKCSTFEKIRPQNPGSIINSTFLFTKVNMDNNATSCFSKRKEYSNNLKLKKRIPSEGQQSSDINQATNRKRFQTSFKRKYAPSRPVFLPSLYQLSKYKTVSNICKPMQEQNNSSTVQDSDITVKPGELKTGSFLTTDNKEKSSLFPYHFDEEICDDNDYESLSDNDNAATDSFLKPYPLIENSQQVYMATNVKTNAKPKSKQKTSEQSKPKFSFSKSTNKVDKPRLSTKRTSLSTKIKTTRTSDVDKCNNDKNTTYTKQLEMRKVLLDEIKACCSLCCKKNAESDNTFRNNSKNSELVSQKIATKGTGLISILKTRNNKNAKKKSVKIDERENIYKEDIELEPKVSCEYWQCSVVQNSPFTNKIIGNDKQESMQYNKLENLNNGITDDDMTFYSSQSIALNKSTICNSEELNTDTTDSFKSSFNVYDETNNENKAITVILDSNLTVHRTDSNPESEYGLICALNNSELNKSKSTEQVDSDKLDTGNMLGLKKSNMFKNINKFFRKKCSKTKCNTSNVS